MSEEKDALIAKVAKLKAVLEAAKKTKRKTTQLAIDRLKEKTE